MDIHQKIIANLHLLQESHLKTRVLYFERGLPFYTCLDEMIGLYRKETKDGLITHVKRVYDWEAKVFVETEIEVIQRPIKSS